MCIGISTSHFQQRPVCFPFGSEPGFQRKTLSKNIMVKCYIKLHITNIRFPKKIP